MADYFDVGAPVLLFSAFEDIRQENNKLNANRWAIFFPSLLYYLLISRFGSATRQIKMMSKRVNVHAERVAFESKKGKAKYLI